MLAIVSVSFVLQTAISHAQDTPPPALSAVEVTATVEPQRVSIGTPFRYIMRVSAPKGVELTIPLLAERIGDFSITDFGEEPAREENGKVVVGRWYSLVAYQSGDQIVPGPTVRYSESGGEEQAAHATDTLVIVESLVDKRGASDVPDIAPPIEVPPDYRTLWMGGAALATLLAVAGAFFFLLNRKRDQQKLAPRPAHEVALSSLARLRASGLLAAGEQKEFYVQLSGIVREYLEGRFHMRAPEMTTEEFLQAAQRNPQLAAPHRQSLSQFLAEADLVKFARHRPTPDDALRAHEAAAEFVEATRPQMEVDRAAA